MQYIQKQRFHPFTKRNTTALLEVSHSPKQCKAQPRRQIGQGMTEYIVVVALIAIAAVTASGFFGARVQAQFVAMGQEISGEAGTPGGNVQAPTAAAANLGSYVDN